MDRVLNEEEWYAQGVLNAVMEFIDEFDERGELREAWKILRNDSHTFRGGIVGQHPERFTRTQLIRPALQSLQYDDADITAEPADLVPDQRSVPDYRVENVHEKCVCIVEAKRFGSLSEVTDDVNEAEEQLESYLSENALVKYKRDLDVRYLIGIATDGVYWTLYVKNLETRENEFAETRSLVETFEDAIFDRRFPDESDEQWNIAQRNRLQENFVSVFAQPEVAGLIERIEDNEIP